MKYLCLVYHDEEVWDALPQRAHDALRDQTLAHRDELRRRGRLIAAHALHPPSSTTTLRVRGGEPSLADGPAAAAGAHLDGFYLIDAADLNDAIRLAVKIPSAPFATIEIRPIKELADH